MKKILSVALVLVMLLGLIPTVVAEETKRYGVYFFKYYEGDDLSVLDDINMSNPFLDTEEGASYTTTLSSKREDKFIESVVVIMGENTPVYPTKNEDGSFLIDIPKVTGNIYIGVTTTFINTTFIGEHAYSYYITNLSHVTSKMCQDLKNDYPDILTTQIKPSGAYMTDDVFTPDEGYEIVDFKVSTSDNFNGNRHDMSDDKIKRNEDGSYTITVYGGSSMYITAVAVPLSEIPTTTEPTSTEITATVPTKPVDVAVKDVTLNKTKLTLNKGTFSTLKAVVTPNNATNKGVTFKSSNTKVAKVTSEGDVLAVGKGNCTITATSKSNSKIKDSCKVTVRQLVTKVQLNKTTLKGKVGKTYKLKAKVTPANANNKGLVWKSSNTKIAKVNQKGQVKALKKGNAVITATAKDGSNKSAKCKIKITK